MMVLAEVLQSWWSGSAHSVSTDLCDLEDKARHVEPVRRPLLRLTLTDSVLDFLTLLQNHKDKWELVYRRLCVLFVLMIFFLFVFDALLGVLAARIPSKRTSVT